MKYRNEIDGLRAIAVIPVILFHAGFERFGGGYVGVDVFFVISGYLITTVILNEKERGEFSIASFYERRTRRILPVLLLVLISSIGFAWILLLPSDLTDFSESLIAVTVFSSSILFWKEAGYFAGAAELKPLLHTWSLAIEEQYYVLYPILLVAVQWLSKRWMFTAIIVLCFFSVGLSQWAAFEKPNANFFLLPTRVWELMIGASAAFLLLYWKSNTKLVNDHRYASEVLGLIGITLIVFSVLVYDQTIPFPSVYTLVPTLGTALIIMFSASSTTVGKILSVKLFVGVGVVSYSAYLWHQPIFVFARHKFGLDLEGDYYFWLMSLTFLLAVISWKLVEKPFRDIRIVSRKTVFLTLIGGSVLVLSMGVLGIVVDGKSPFLSDDLLIREELIAKNKSERQKAINAGICHFNKKGKHTEIGSFISNWS